MIVCVIAPNDTNSPLTPKRMRKGIEDAAGVAERPQFLIADRRNSGEGHVETLKP